MLVTNQNFQDALRRVRAASTVCLDTETSGLRTWGDDRIIGVAVKVDDAAMYFPFRHAGGNLEESCLPELIAALTGKAVRGFHLRFDLEMLAKEGLPPPPHIQDTLHAAILMNENEPTFALKRGKAGPGLCMRYLGPETVVASDRLDDILASRRLTKGDLNRLTAEEVADYACDDVILSDRLFTEVYEEPIRRWSLGAMLEEYGEYQQLLIAMETEGLPIDEAVVLAALAEGEAARADLLKQIHAAAGREINPGSPVQISRWLGTPDAKEETLLACGNPAADLIIRYKAYVKRDSTYLVPFLEGIEYDGKLHPSPNLVPKEDGTGGTRSGRLSYSGPNLQATPKVSEKNPVSKIYAPVRRAIVAPPGYTLVEADYSQAEVRKAASLSTDQRLTDLVMSGADVYQDLADKRGMTRQASKTLFLAIQYGAGVWKIMEMLGVGEAEATRLRGAWHKHFPRVSNALRRMASHAEKTHCFRYISGRWAHFDGSSKSATCRSPFYTAWNHLVQGEVADMIRRAMLALWKELRERAELRGVKMLLQVHDSLLFLVPTARLAEVIPIIKAVMEDFPEDPVPPKVDFKIGPNWLDMTEYKEAA